MSPEKTSASDFGDVAIEDVVRERRWVVPCVAVPSWLVSAIVHLAALLVLALSTYSRVEPSKEPLILGLAAAHVEPELFEIAIRQAEWEKESVSDFNLSDAGELTVDLVSDSTTPTDEGLATAPEMDGNLLSIVPGAEMAAGGRDAMKSFKKGAEFYGVKAAGLRFVFVVDSSNSMRGGRFRDAKHELLYAIRQLSADQYFYVVFFDHNAARMTFAPNTEPESQPVAATVENINKLEAWVATVENERLTNPHDAMKFALELSPDAIYLLSDGQFTDKGRTVRYLQSANFVVDPKKGKLPKVNIHTLGFYSRDGEEALKSIARSYKGTYRFVPEPDRRAMR